jgi:hypothetical protein
MEQAPPEAVNIVLRRLSQRRELDDIETELREAGYSRRAIGLAFIAAGEREKRQGEALLRLGAVMADDPPPPAA